MQCCKINHNFRIGKRKVHFFCKIILLWEILSDWQRYSPFCLIIQKETTFFSRGHFYAVIPLTFYIFIVNKKGVTIDRDKTSINLNENKDSLLLATLAYNVGYGTLMGNANHPKSRLIQKIESGGRNIHNDYIRFCRYKGKVVPSIRKRRKVELLLLFHT